MDDLISRQAAIDKLKREEKIFYSPTGLRYLIGAIRDLPSAQPQDIARDIATIIENEKDMRVVLKQPRWIPCSERLPDEDLWIGGKQFSDRVQMTVYDKNDEDTIVDYGHTIDGEWYSDTADEFIESIEDWKVIAWMPLPEPYKGEES